MPVNTDLLGVFKQVGSRLQQQGLRGLADDQQALDAEEEERKKAAARQAQMDAARERFEALTSGIGSTVGGAASDLGTAARAAQAAVRTTADQASEAVTAAQTAAQAAATQAAQAAAAPIQRRHDELAATEAGSALAGSYRMPDRDPTKPSFLGWAGQGIREQGERMAATADDEETAAGLAGLAAQRKLAGGALIGAGHIGEQLGDEAEEMARALPREVGGYRTGGLPSGDYGRALRSVLEAGLGAQDVYGAAAHGAARTAGAPEPVADALGLVANVAAPSSLVDDLSLVVGRTGLRVARPVLEHFAQAMGPARVAQMLRLDPESIIGTVRRVVDDFGDLPGVQAGTRGLVPEGTLPAGTGSEAVREALRPLTASAARAARTVRAIGAPGAGAVPDAASMTETGAGDVLRRLHADESGRLGPLGPAPPAAAGGATTTSPTKPTTTSPTNGPPGIQGVRGLGAAATPTPGRTPPQGTLEKASDFVQRYRYVNALGNPANAIWDVLSTMLNIPRLAVRTGLGTLNERLMGVPREARATTLGEVRGMGEGIRTGAADALGGVLGALVHEIKPVATEQAGQLLTGPLKVASPVLEFGTRLRAANDGFVTHLGQNMAAHMLGHREAFREGLTGDAYKRRVVQVAGAIQQRFGAAKQAGETIKQGGTAQPLVTGRTTPYGAKDTADYDALTREAQAMTRRLIFQQAGGASATALGGARGNSLLGWFVMFFKTLANIGAEGLTLTPAGMAGTALDAARGSTAGRGLFGERLRGPYADAYAQAKAAGEVPTNLPGHGAARTSNPAVLPASQRWAEHQLGLALIAAGAVLGSAGLLTGEGPDDPDANEQWREEGHRKYAVRVGGEEVPIVRLLGPLALPLIMGAVGAEHHRETGEFDVDLMQDVILTSSTEWAKLSGLGAFADTFAALMQPDDAKKLQLLQRALGQNAGTLVPFAGLQRAVEQATDPLVRDPRTVWEGIIAGVPGLAGQLPPERDELGSPVERPAGETGLRSLLPFQSSAPQEGGLRRYNGSQSAADDAAIARALNKVQTYERLKTERKPISQAEFPTPEEQALAKFYKGKENPQWEKWRPFAREQERRRKGMDDQAVEAVSGLLARLNPSAGAGAGASAGGGGLGAVLAERLGEHLAGQQNRDRHQPLHPLHPLRPTQRARTRSR